MACNMTSSFIPLRRNRFKLVGAIILLTCHLTPQTSAFCLVGEGKFLGRKESSSQKFRFPATLQPLDDSPEKVPIPDLPSKLEKMPIWKIFQLSLACFAAAVLLIAWEDLSMAHPMRQYSANQPFSSTVKGMGFGELERQALQGEFEPTQLQSIRSYNEVMLQHRTERVPSWKTPISKGDVLHSVSVIQRCVLHIEDCKVLASSYEWETLSNKLQDPILHSELERACGVLKRAEAFLSSEAREIVGFDWGSCAWRHCGAFADAEESIDELDHLLGILEPFEALFILDIVERSFRDILAVTQQYADPEILLPAYTPIQRMADASAEGEGTLDEEYLAALQFLKQLEE